MESTPTENEKISIYLPGAEKSQMEVVLKFLYTGRLSLTKAMITPVRELLEEVLKEKLELLNLYSWLMQVFCLD